MSSEHDHHEEGGAHEIDKMPYARLFNLLVGLSALTLLACIGVIQIFNLQVRQVTDDYAAEGEKDSALAEYRAEAAQVGAGYGRFEFELEGKVEERFHVPLQAAKKQVMEDPKLLDGPGSYRGWDDSPVGKQIKDWGGMPVPKPAEPVKRPGAEEAVDGKAPPTEKPAEDAKGDDAKGDDAKGDDAKGGDAKGDDAKGGDAKGGDAKGGDAKGDDAKGGDAKGDDAEGEPAKGGEGKRRRGKSGTGTGAGTARPSAGDAKADG